MYCPALDVGSFIKGNETMGENRPEGSEGPARGGGGGSGGGIFEGLPGNTSHPWHLKVHETGYCRSYCDGFRFSWNG